MKTEMTKARLAEAVQAVKGLVARDGLSAFSKIRLDASGYLSVTGSNGDVQVEWRIDGEVAERGTYSVPGAAFAAFVGAMPEGLVRIATDGSGHRVVMEGGGVVFKLAAFGGESGNDLGLRIMTGPEDGATISVGAALLREMLRKVRFAVSTDGTRAALKGVNVVLKDGLLNMTATDGRRLAHVEHEMTESVTFDFTLPAKAVGVLYGLLEKAEAGKLVTVTADKKAVRIVCDSWCMTSKVLVEVFPNWKRVVPAEQPYQINIDRELFLGALGRVALASDEESGVKIKFSESKATFEAKNEFTSARAEMQVSDYGPKGDSKFEFLVNPRLVKDALEAIDEDQFQLHADGKYDPVKITCSLPWVAVVMPFRRA